MDANESLLIDSHNPEHPPVTATPPLPPRIWKFWGTALWGLFIFGGMFIGQAAVIGYLVLRMGGPLDMASAIRVVGGGLTISLSVIMGVPAVLLAAWIAIRVAHAVRRLSRAALDLVAAISCSVLSAWRCWWAAGICCRNRSDAR